MHLNGEIRLQTDGTVNQWRNNMEQFSLTEYLKNPTRPIVTRDGNIVRIICTDRVAVQPIVALVQTKNRESLFTYTANGKYDVAETATDLDLFFAAKPKAKRVGWMNVCKYGDDKHFSLVGGVIHPTREAALKETPDYVVDTIQIRWEE